MTTAADLKKVMDALNNYKEGGGTSGHNGNITKIWEELQPSLQGQPWCAATVCYVWKHAGHPYPAIDHPWGFSYCPDAVIWAKKHGLWDESGHYEFGDTTFWGFDGTGVAEHTGSVVKDDGRTVLDFEGNTSPDGGFGSQADGGGAYFRHRQHGPQMLGVLKSSRWLTDHPAHTLPPHDAHHPLNTPTHNPFRLDPHALPLKAGAHSPSVKWLQWALSIPVDGQFGPQTAKAVVVWKKHAGSKTPDPIVRAAMAAQVMKITH